MAGRGALIEAIRRAREKNAAQAPGAEQPAVVAAPEEPPKPRGRAALLNQMKAMKLSEPAKAPAEKPPPAEPAPPSPSTSRAPVGAAGDAPSDPPETEAVTFRGESGKPVSVIANYIKLEIEKDMGVFEYEVKFDPPVDSKNIRVKLLNSKLPELGGVKMFDGGSCLYLPVKTPQGTLRFNVEHPFEKENFEMTIIYKKQKQMRDSIHLFNVLFKRIMNVLKFSRIGRNYFDPVNPTAIPQHRMEILPGYAIAVDEYEGGLMLCLDTQHRVLRTISGLELMRDLHRSSRPEQFRQNVRDQLIGKVVITRYNNKTYTVDDILWDVTPKDTFENSKGDSLSFADYYARQHGLNVTDMHQCMLLNMQKRKISGTAREEEMRICLIPEFCFLTGLSDIMLADFKVMKDVAQVTRITPHQRAASLHKYIKSVENSEAARKIMKDWGMTIKDAMIDLNARILSPELITFGGGGTHQCDMKADWTSALSRNKCFGPVDVNSWVIIFVERDQKLAREFAENTMRLGKTMGCYISQPMLHGVKNDRTGTFNEACNTIINDNVQVVVFLVNSMRDDLYSLIKRITCCVKPVGSQVIQCRNLSNPKKSRTVTLKVALQINCKLGGSLWALRIPVKSWMVCGIDVYHSPGSKKSVAALVSSMNETMTSYYTSVVMQEKELIDALKTIFLRALIKWRDYNGNYPQQVIIYRDGVGDGQLDHVSRYELEQLKGVVSHLQIPKLDICLIVVQKRINTRIISRDSTGNPPPGTILDHTVTKRHYPDFLLVPQNVTQGTVSPTHYVILHNSNNIKPDHVQRLTFKMCHLYYNWSGTIRVPAPCQYAHKVAYLVGQHIGKAPAECLSDRLYYL